MGGQQIQHQIARFSIYLTLKLRSAENLVKSCFGSHKYFRFQYAHFLGQYLGGRWKIAKRFNRPNE